jgi:hypothetical protein
MLFEQNVEQFKATWNDLIPKIETNVIDGDGVSRILLYFGCYNDLFFGANKDDDVAKYRLELELMESRLIVALEVAHSKFRLANRGALAKFFGGLTNHGLKVITKK